MPVTDDAIIDHNTYIGVRRCPNEKCRGILFFARGKDGNVKTLPYRRIDVDTTGIPLDLRSPLEEAISCHASGCYVAAAMMIRRTLVALCQDLGINDGDLSSRLESLGKMIIMPPALLAGVHKLRMLGNDAASIESKAYHDVGREEAQVGIECATEILQAAYRYKSLVGRLEALKTHPPTP